MGSLARYICCGKEMMVCIREKMAIQESTLGGAKFFASSLIAVGNDALTYNSPCTVGEAYSTVVRNGS